LRQDADNLGLLFIAYTCNKMGALGLGAKVVPLLISVTVLLIHTLAFIYPQLEGALGLMIKVELDA